MLGADLATGSHVVLTPLFVVAPLALSFVAGGRATIAVAVLASVLVASSALWVDRDPGSAAYWVPLVVVLAGSAASVGGALAREGLVGAVRELADVRRRLDAILRNLDEAVTVNDAQGRFVYANPAAAALVQMPSAEEMVEQPPGAIMSRFEVTREDGTPVDLDDLPSRRILHGLPAEPTLVRNRVLATGEERWLLHRATAVHDDDGRLALIVSVIEDVTTAKRAERAQRLLAEAGRLLTEKDETEDALRRIADLLVPQWTEWCVIDVAGAPGMVETVAVAHADPERVQLAREVRGRYPVAAGGAPIVSGVLRTGRTFCTGSLDPAALERQTVDGYHRDLLRAIGIRSMLVVPVRAGVRTLGTITLISSRPDWFGQEDIALAEELGRRAGAALRSARLTRERAEIAHTLQAGLLPAALPRMPRWQTASLYRPAGQAIEVGGDFYDAFAVPGGWTLIVGDVAGKGPRAASVTGMARHTLRTATRLSGRLVRAYAELNEALLDEPELSLCTVGGLRLTDAWARIVCGGHPLPVLVREGESRLVGRTGPLLGAFAGATWPEDHVDLLAGDVLVLYTDGVLDAVGAGGQRFGEERLLAALAPASGADDAVRRVDAALDAFSEGEQRDDLAVIAVEWEGALEVAEALPAGSTAPLVARRAVRRAIDGQVSGELLDRALVLASELVTNAVRHGAGPVELRARVGSTALRVEVVDGGSGFEPVVDRAPGPHGGFGLVLVSQESDRWGADAEGGTRVWFELDLPPER